jgi:hypothetical protein
MRTSNDVIADLTFNDKVQILKEYKTLQETGALGESMIRTLAGDEVFGFGGIVLNMINVANIVAHQLADEYITKEIYGTTRVTR